MIYRLLRPVLFRLPAEAAHRMGSAVLRTALDAHSARSGVRRTVAVNDPALAVTRWGLRFPNPVGLAAGFDKSGSTFNALAALGFGSVEIGTVTARPQTGNPAPRLFRLPRDQALLNRMGFNNPGADAVAARLASGPIEPLLGINVGKSKVTPLDDAVDDYLYSVERLAPFARYLVVNVSSPNTPGLRSLQDPAPLRRLVRALRAAVATQRSAEGQSIPILLKIAPDLTDAEVDQVVDVALEEGAAGIVATNTTVSREGLATPARRVSELWAGGISGAPVRARAVEIVRHIFCRTEGQLPVVGVGGIFDADDAWEYLRAGASLVQIYTGFVYGGPLTPRRINRGLLALLRRHGFRSIGEVVGSGA